MGDSDDTYDFTDLERFIAPLRDGYDLVIGNQFKGQILPGVMPWTPSLYWESHTIRYLATSLSCPCFRFTLRDALL